MAGHGGGGAASRFKTPQNKPKNMKQTIKRLFSYIATAKILFVLLIITILLYTGATLYSSILVKDIIGSLGEFNSDTLLFTKMPDPNKFLFYLVVMLIIIFAICILQYFSSLLGAYISCIMVRKMRNELFAKVVHLPISYTDSHPHGDLMSRMTNDVDNISQAVSSSISSLISGILTIMGCLFIMVFYSPLLTLVALSTLVLTLIFTAIMSKYMRPLFSKQQKVLGVLNTSTEEMVTGCKTVIAYNQQDHAIKEFNESSNQLTKIGIKAQILSGSMGPVMNFIGNFGYFIVTLCGALFIMKGIGNTLLNEPLTIAIVIMFLSTTKQFTRPINEIAQLYSSLMNAFAGAERVFAILDEKEESFEKKVDFDVNSMKGTIDFEHVNFSYVKGKQVLKDFNIDIRAGHKIALVGATGSGKTTIVNLLLNFYDIDSGEIKIDNINIKDISKKDLRDSISIVLQDPVLFFDTIENNVRYGNENATEEEIDNALKFANCSSFIKQLPEGKHTILNEGATNISQGQRQLLTIARAVLANPKILILDEATSSVDTRTEKKIQNAMDKLMENRTSIIIAHRLSTIQDADLILVLDQGHIVEQGNHHELIEKNGVYNRLYQTQFKGIQI